MTARALLLCLALGLAGPALANGAEPEGETPEKKQATAPEEEAAKECTSCTARHKSLQRLQETLTAPKEE